MKNGSQHRQFIFCCVKNGATCAMLCVGTSQHECFNTQYDKYVNWRHWNILITIHVYVLIRFLKAILVTRDK